MNLNNPIKDILNNNIPPKTITELSLNSEFSVNPLSVKNLVISEKKCFHSDSLSQNNNTVDALDYNNNTYFFIEFKDEKVYDINHNWAKIMVIASKSFQTINEIIKLYKDNNLSKNEFYKDEITLILVFSPKKSTIHNDFTSLKRYLTERYGNIFKIDVLDSNIFTEKYLNNNKIGFN
jgi:hypothetical protein